MKQINIALPEHLLQPLVNLIDAGLKSAGLQAARHAADIADLIQVGVDEAKVGDAE